jgi:hypothetical protein
MRYLQQFCQLKDHVVNHGNADQTPPQEWHHSLARTEWNAPTEVVHQLGYDYPVLGGLNDGWKTRETRRYCAKASAG